MCPDISRFSTQRIVCVRHASGAVGQKMLYLDVNWTALLCACNVRIAQ